MHLKQLSLIIILLLLTFSVSGIDKNDKAVRPVQSEDKQEDELPYLVNALNTKETFNNIIYQETYVFMVGNNKYEPGSGVGELAQCYNDLMLLKGIFKYCLKIKEQNIFINKDLNLEEFRKKFIEFVLKVNKNSRIIFYYSGHGLKDGSLLFVDGSTLVPGELKYHINSFDNDTILMIDACYSGTNDGPKEINTDVSFKKNCWRIYAALAHQTAREDIYKDNFFKAIMPFYKDVLNIPSIEGNSFFTALWGMFFATYQFKAHENLSFRDLVYYISGTSKQYVEYLTTKGEDYESTAIKIFNRTNQLPIIYPISESINFKEKNSKYLILQDNSSEYWPQGNFFTAAPGIIFPIPFDPAASVLNPGIYPLLSLTYNMRWNKSICGIGLLTGINYMTSKADVDFPGSLSMYPFALRLSYSTAFPILLFFDIDLDIGISVLHPQDSEALSTFFYGAASVNLGFSLSTNTSLELSGHYIMIARNDEINSFIAPGLLLAFHF